jgi:hypothetical protein
VGLANLGSELETCVGSRVRLVGVLISFEKNFYRLPFTPSPSLVRRIGPSMFCSGCRGKFTKKRQQQGDDDKIEEMDMVSIKRRWGNGSTTHT